MQSCDTYGRPIYRSPWVTCCKYLFAMFAVTLSLLSNYKWSYGLFFFLNEHYNCVQYNVYLNSTSNFGRTLWFLVGRMYPGTMLFGMPGKVLELKALIEPSWAVKYSSGWAWDGTLRFLQAMQVVLVVLGLVLSDHSRNFFERPSYKLSNNPLLSELSSWRSFRLPGDRSTSIIFIHRLWKREEWTINFCYFVPVYSTDCTALRGRITLHPMNQFL